MNPLHQAIRAYYFDHFDELPADKQFHFVSRLSAWSKDTKALKLLDVLKPSMVTNTTSLDLEALLATSPPVTLNAAARRAPYFAKYPELFGLMLALFRVRHLLFHYGIDTRDELLAFHGKDALYALSDRLQQDSEALMILTTYAINYIYLVESILFPRNDTPMNSFIHQLPSLADIYTDTPEDSLLLIYLYTHCIIGASNFYQMPVQHPVYLTMLSLIEQRIAAHFDHINLDNKFEFLVCCKLASFETTLEEAIHEEAAQSLSPHGTFLVDTINQAAQKNKVSFAASEHRNVLYIMGSVPYLPWL